MAKLVGNGSVAGVKSKEAAMIMAVQEVGWGVLPSQWALVPAWVLFNVFINDAGSNSKQWFNEIHR